MKKDVIKEANVEVIKPEVICCEPVVVKVRDIVSFSSCLFLNWSLSLCVSVFTHTHIYNQNEVTCVKTNRKTNKQKI